MGVCIYTVCKRGGLGCVKSIFYRNYTLCVFDQIPKIQNCFITPKKPRRGGGPQADKNLPQRPFTGLLKKSRHLGLKSISYLVHERSLLLELFSRNLSKLATSCRTATCPTPPTCCRLTRARDGNHRDNFAKI
jgi:hypothetical protein